MMRKKAERMEQTAVSGNLDNMAMKGLEEAERGLTIEKNQWPADIDEAGNRYVEFVIGGAEKTLLVQQISFVLEGKICYRIAYARGKDFYPRTDMGERQQATDSKHAAPITRGNGGTADTQDLGSCGAIRGGSSPPSRIFSAGRPFRPFLFVEG